MPNKGNRPRIDTAEGSVAVNAPVAAVYKRWLAFEDFPKFIPVIKRVRKLDANHFVASLGFNGKQYDTTLEVMLCVPEPPENRTTLICDRGCAPSLRTRAGETIG